MFYKMVVLSVIISVIYSVLIFWLYKGWVSISAYSVPESETNIFVSVVVCAHNEEFTLPRLLYALSRQTSRSFEVIVVNDHSTDATISILEDWTARMDNLRIVSAQGRGKKSALAEGISVSRGSVVLQTDADCLVSSRWVETMSCLFSGNNCDLVIGPVSMDSRNGWEAAQSLEFLSLVASGAGAAGQGKPIMCNGANLAYSKKLWSQVEANQHSELLSGDDMFLLLEAKKKGSNILFLKSEEAIVHTYPCRTFLDFIRQRQRWASKSGAYRDIDVIFVAMCVMLVSLLPIVSLLFGMPILFLCQVFFKSLVDFLFLRKVSTFFSQRKSLKMIPLVEFVYPFYIVFCGISGWFRKRSW